MGDQELRFRRRKIFQIPLAELWPLLTETDRINRAATIPATTFLPAVRSDGMPYTRARARYLGIPVRWDVLPFEWSFERWFAVDYVFQGVPFLEKLGVGLTFYPLSPQQTEIELHAHASLRGPLGGPLMRLLLGWHLLNRYMSVYRTIEQRYREGHQEFFPKPQRSKVDEEQLALAMERLAQQPAVSPELAARLRRLLTEAVDQDVMGIRPFVLADSWGVDRLEVLRLCLYATSAGLLDASWEVLCPNCRVAKASFTSLATLQPQAHCETCNIDYDANFDQYVELRFNVNPAIRRAEIFSYCVAEPARLQHIRGQVRVAPGSRRELELDLPLGTYKLRVPRWPGRTLIQVLPGAGGEQLAAAAEIRCRDGALMPEELSLRAGPCTIALINEGQDELLAIFEQDAWDAQGASAALVTSLQEFRQLFSSEVLSPGLGVSVRNLTVLFTDLKGSTRLYANIGDPSAFALVRDHFVVLQQVLQRRRGALVKTIGDAVMAVFYSAQDGVEAALEMLDEIERLNERYPDQPSLHLKIGLHQGPCIAVNANDILDYFGSTVNLAARAQGESLGDDFVLTQALMDDPGVRQVVEALDIAPEVFQTTPKGFNVPVTLYRFAVARGLAVDQQHR